MSRTIPATINYSESSYPKIFNEFLKGKKIWCIRHGSHNDWRVTEKKSGYKYIRCGHCYRDASNKFKKDNPIWAILNDAKQHSKKLNRKFELKLEDIVYLLEKQNNRCFYSKIKFDNGKYKISIDQKNPGKGYFIGNINLVTYPINLMKSNFSEKKFISICKHVHKPIKKKISKLKLLKYAIRRKTPKDLLEELRLFKKNGIFPCKIHGSHEKWYISRRKGVDQAIRCGKCQLDYHRKKNSKNEIDKRRRKAKEKKINEKNLLRFKENKKCYCVLHGYHNDFRKDGRSIRCRKCAIIYSNEFEKNNPFSRLFTYAKYRSKQSKAKFSLDFNFLIDLYIKQNGKCALTGLTLDNKNNRPSVDRINSRIGYTNKNVQITIYDVNQMKSDLDLKEFIKQCSLVAKNN